MSCSRTQNRAPVDSIYYEIKINCDSRHTVIKFYSENKPCPTVQIKSKVFRCVQNQIICKESVIYDTVLILHGLATLERDRIGLRFCPNILKYTASINA